MCQNIICQTQDPQFVINEIYNGDLNSDNAFIEILVIGTTVPCSSPDQIASSLIVDDSNISSSMQPGYLAIRPECLVGIEKGDLILIHGKNTKLTKTDAQYRFSIDDTCIEKWADYPNAKDSSYNKAVPVLKRDASLKDFIGLEKRNLALQLRTNDKVFQKVKLTGQRRYSLTHGDFNEYKELKETPMKDNSTANASFRSAIISQGNQFIIKTKVFDSGNNSKPIVNDIKLKICNGTPPFIVETTDYNNPMVEERTLVIYDLPCGVHTVTVTDSEGEVRTREVAVSPTDCVFLSACIGAEITLPLLECLNLPDNCYSWFPEALFSDQPDGNKTRQPTITVPNQPGILELELYVSNNNGNVSGVFSVFIDISVDEDGDGLCGDNDPDDNNVCDPLGYLNVSIEDTSDADPEIMCANTSKTLIAYVGGSWIWNTGAITQSITITGPGAYSVTATDSNGCTGEDQIIVNEYSVPEINILDEYIYCNDLAHIILEGPSHYSYLWDNGMIGQEIQISDPEIQINDSETYTVTVSNQGVCETVYSTTVVALEGDDCCETTPPLTIAYDGDFLACQGGTATITVTLTGGSAPYELNIGNLYVESAIELGIGVYELEIWPVEDLSIIGTDLFNCISEEGHEEITITEISDGNDTDDDGICDTLDPDPNDPCNPFIDSDGDGICSGLDCDDDDALVGIGMSCWDNNTCTYNDVYDENCDCVGTLIEGCDCNLGDPCDDSNPCTENDVIINATCGCLGTEIIGCEECHTGTPCDDKNDCTVNDTFDINCDCVGEDVSEDGIACNDGNECTFNDSYVDCECVGMPIEANVTSCDDGDDCTNDDRYNDDCECRGDRVVEFVIIEDLPACENGNGTLAVEEIEEEVDYSEFEWKLNGVTISNERECPVYSPGLYQIIVHDENGCYTKVDYEVIDFTNPNIQIESTQNSICKSEDMVYLSISTDLFESAEWYDPQGNSIGLGESIEIGLPGTYTVEATDQNGCLRYGEKSLDQEFGPIVEIQATDEDVCGDIFTLEIEKSPDATITWGGPPGFDNPLPYVLTASSPGIYSVHVSGLGENGDCEAYDEYEVIDAGNNEDLTEYFLSNGFEEYTIINVMVVPALQNGLQRSLSSDCQNFECFAAADYHDVQFEGFPDLVIDDLDDYFQDIICSESDCGTQTKGIFISSICNSISTDLDFFMNYAEEEEQRLQVYIMHDEVTDEPVKMFLKHSVDESKCEAFAQDPYAFEHLFFDLVCGVYNSESSILLDQHLSKESFSSGNIRLFDNNLYSGLAFTFIKKTGMYLRGNEDFILRKGFVVLNYKQGEELNLSGLDWKENYSFEFSPCGQFEFSGDELSALEIPYYNNCGDPLVILINTDEMVQFQNLFEDPQGIVDAQKDTSPNNPAYNIGVWEKTPPCLTNYCEDLRFAIPDCESTMEVPYNSLNIVKHVIRHWNPDDVILCADYLELVDSYNCLELDREDEFHEHLMDQFYRSNRFKTQEVSIIDQEVDGNVTLAGKQIYQIFGDLFAYAFNPDYVNVDHGQHGLSTGFTYVHSGNKDFNYFDTYELRIQKDFNFLPTTRQLPTGIGGDSGELFNYKVPGLYVPYALSKWQKNQNIEDVILTFDIAASALSLIFFPYSGFAHLTKLTRIQKLNLAYQTVDLTVGVGGLFVDQVFCEDIFGPAGSVNSAWFCEEFKKFKGIADLVLLGGAAVETASGLKPVQDAFNAMTPVEQASFSTYMASKIENTEDFIKMNRVIRGLVSVDVIMDLLKTKYYPNLWNHRAFSFHDGSSGLEKGALRKIADAYVAGDINAAKLFDDDLAAYIDNAIVSHETSRNAAKFFNHVASTIGNTSSPALAHKLEDLTPGGYEAWKSFDEVMDYDIVEGTMNSFNGSAANMDVLEALARARQNGDLESFLISKYGESGYLPFLDILMKTPISRGHALNNSGEKPWVNFILEAGSKFSSQYRTTPGFEAAFLDLTESSFKTQGTYWFMQFANEHEWSNVDFNVDDEAGDYRVDIYTYHPDDEIISREFQASPSGVNYLEDPDFVTRFSGYINSPQGYPTMASIEINTYKGANGFVPELLHFEELLDQVLIPNNLGHYQVFFNISDPVNSIEELKPLIAGKFSEIFK